MLCIHPPSPRLCALSHNWLEESFSATLAANGSAPWTRATQRRARATTHLPAHLYVRAVCASSRLPAAVNARFSRWSLLCSAQPDRPVAAVPRQRNCHDSEPERARRPFRCRGARGCVVCAAVLKARDSRPSLSAAVLAGPRRGALCVSRCFCTCTFPAHSGTGTSSSNRSAPTLNSAITWAARKARRPPPSTAQPRLRPSRVSLWPRKQPAPNDRLPPSAAAAAAFLHSSCPGRSSLSSPGLHRWSMPMFSQTEARGLFPLTPAPPRLLPILLLLPDPSAPWPKLPPHRDPKNPTASPTPTAPDRRESHCRQSSSAASLACRRLQPCLALGVLPPPPSCCTCRDLQGRPRGRQTEDVDALRINRLGPASPPPCIPTSQSPSAAPSRWATCSPSQNPAAPPESGRLLPPPSFPPPYRYTLVRRQAAMKRFSQRVVSSRKTA